MTSKNLFIEELEILTDKLGEENKIPPQYLMELLDLTTAAWWYWDIRSGYDYLSRGWCDLMGYEYGELPNHVSSWLETMHPEDHTLADEAMKAHLLFKKPYYLKARYKTKTGEYITSIDIGKVVHFDSVTGEPLSMVGFQRRAE